MVKNETLFLNYEVTCSHCASQCIYLLNIPSCKTPSIIYNVN